MAYSHWDQRIGLHGPRQIDAWDKILLSQFRFHAHGMDIVHPLNNQGFRNERDNQQVSIKVPRDLVHLNL